MNEILNTNKIEITKNETDIIPIDSFILVLMDSVNEKTKGGIILPEQTKDRESASVNKCTLVAFGDDCFNTWNEKPKIGQRLMIMQYAGYSYEHDGKKYRICQDTDVCAKLKEGE